MEKIIAKIQDLCLCLIKARTEFAKFDELIEAEHESITKTDIDRIEVIAREKLILGQEFEQQVFIAQRLAHEIAALTLNDQVSVKNISHLIEKLENHEAEWSTEKSWTDAIQKLSSEFRSLQDLRDRLRQPIDLNKRVLSKLLASRQQNYAFWQKITADAQAPYNARGHQSARSKSSAFKVTA